MYYQYFRPGHPIIVAFSFGILTSFAITISVKFARKITLLGYHRRIMEEIA
jgi:hypothetical protein